MKEAMMVRGSEWGAERRVLFDVCSPPTMMRLVAHGANAAWRWSLRAARCVEMDPNCNPEVAGSYGGQTAVHEAFGAGPWAAALPGPLPRPDGEAHIFRASAVYS